VAKNISSFNRKNKKFCKFNEFNDLQFNDSFNSLNMEMQKHKEIARRLSGILAHVIPLLPQDHQASAAAAVERAKSITPQVCGFTFYKKMNGRKNRKITTLLN
jgi:hypothetical protein